MMKEDENDHYLLRKKKVIGFMKNERSGKIEYKKHNMVHGYKNI